MNKEERSKFYKYSQGLDAWHVSSTKDLKPLTMNDGPCGVRKPSFEEFTKQDGIMEATAGLSPSAIAASFSKKAAYLNGEILADDCINKGVEILLAPGINIKRSVLCGRNFEYFSEDPFLAGRLASEYINGLQNHGVRACVKHYCANNKELARKVCSSEISLRALNEIYLRPFSYVIKHSNPFSLMTSYNQVNGEYVPESDYLLNKKLKGEYGYKGLIMSDWCAVNNKARAIKTGLHVEMPIAYRSDEYMDSELEKGHFSEEDLIRNDNEFHEAVESFKTPTKKLGLSEKEIHQLCINNANEVPVLVKNEDNYFPLDKKEKVLYIGYSVNNQMIVGDGSANVNPRYKGNYIDVLLDKNVPFEFVRGCDERDKLCTTKTELEFYKGKVDKVVLFLSGLKNDEVENEDRANISFRKSQLDLYNLVKETFGNFGVVVVCGAVYDIEKIYNESKAMLITYFSGEGQYEAIFNNLYGIHNPSGRLPETWISSLDSHPLYEHFLKRDMYYEYYDEDIYVGYRYYVDNKPKFILPFGFGLSYSSFEYNNFEVHNDGNSIIVSGEISNKSNMDGEDVVQIYIGKKNSNIYRCKYELKEFEKVSVKANSTSKFSINISIDDLSVYDKTTDKMIIEDGDYEVYLCKNSMNPICMKIVNVRGNILNKVAKPDNLPRKEVPNKFSLASTCEEFMALGVGKVMEFAKQYPSIDSSKLISILEWNCGMAFNELMWFDGMISFDLMLKMIDFYNK